MKFKCTKYYFNELQFCEMFFYNSLYNTIFSKLAVFYVEKNNPHFGELFDTYKETVNYPF